MAKQEEIREGVGDLEHQQWVHWTRYMLNNLTPGNISQWLRQMDTPYDELTEEEKRSDKNWADKVFKYLHSQGVVIKVDRELSEVEKDNFNEYFDGLEGMDSDRIKQAGYVAFEPLIA